MNKIEFQKSLASKYLDHDLELLLILENLLDSTVEPVERSVCDLDGFSDNEWSDVFLILFELLINDTEYPVDFRRSQGNRLFVFSLSFCKETGYVWNIPDDVLQLSSQMSLDKYVAWKEDTFPADT